MKWIILILLFVPLSLFDTKVDNEISEERCISALVEHEASSENLAGKRAVMDVLLERMKRSKSICHVEALKPKQFSNFSWKKMIETKFSLQEYEKYATMSSVCKTCTHFHRDDKSPNWKNVFKFRRQIGRHLYYQEN